MKIRHFIRVVALLTSLVLILSLCSCGKNGSTHPDLIKEWTSKENLFSFSSLPSENLHFSQSSADAVLSAVKKQQVNYEYAYLYQLEEVIRRLDFDASAEKHQYSALDADGKLNAAHLAELVTENNEIYLENNSFGHEKPEENYILEICDFIIFYVEQIYDKHPDIDWQRVYCNLGNLKILYNTGMLSYAQVSKDLVLSISKVNTGIVLNIKGEDAFSRVLIHEIMHIIQIGCQCEEIENCSRRAGMSVYWDDFSLNTGDWTWLVEGSAERMMCNLTGKDAVSYQYKMDYICSFTLSVLLRDDVQADTMETLCFYSDVDLLFDTFGCETPAQREEIIKLMITTNILQMQPTEFFEIYKEATGIDLNENEDALNNFRYSLKPSICITLAKEFYENLTLFLLENSMTANDLFFILNLFESHLNQHLRYDDESKSEINASFISGYNVMRKALFEALTIDNPQLDFEEFYQDYQIFTEDGKINADLSILPDDKRNFLLERAQWLYELNGLGISVKAQ